MITEKDIERAKILARWYCLPADALARKETNEDLWAPTNPEAQTEEARTEFEGKVHAVRRRLAKLKRIDPVPNYGIGPIVDSVMSGISTQDSWFATRYATNLASLPWTMRASINPLLSAHAWMSAEIGMGLERAGYTALSERELSTAVDQHGNTMPEHLVSTYTSPQGRTTEKKPDLAVMAPNGEDFIAIEAERDNDRPLRVYREKLDAYRHNNHMRCVWYVVSQRITGQRVMRAAKEIGMGSDFLKIIINEPRGGFHYFTLQDLNAETRAGLDFTATR